MVRLVVDENIDLADAVQRVVREAGIRPQHVGIAAVTLRAAIDDYRQLFRPQQLAILAARRRLALEAMHSLAAFTPRLAGPLVHGDGPLEHVRLLLPADSPEQVIMHLRDNHIPWQTGEVTLRHASERRLAHPALRFVAGDAQIELVILDPRYHSDPPQDALGAGKLLTLNAAELTRLLQDTEKTPLQD